MEFVDKHIKDLMAFSILLICLISLIFKGDKTDSLSQSLGYIITGYIITGYLFRGKHK